MGRGTCAHRYDARGQAGGLTHGPLSLEAGGECRGDAHSENAEGHPGGCQPNRRAGGRLAYGCAGQGLDRAVHRFREGLEVLERVPCAG